MKKKKNSKVRDSINNFKAFIGNVRTVLKRPELIILPGQLAFFFVLSLVPAITLLSYFSSSFHISSEFVYNFLEKALNSNIASLVRNSLTNNQLGLRFYLSLFLGYYLASNGPASMIVTSNAIYGIKDGGFFKRRIKAFVMTIFLIILFVFMLAVPLFGQKIIELIEYVNLNPNITEVITKVFIFLKGPFSWLVIFIFMKVLFTMAPDKKVPSRNVNIGAIFTTVLWIIITYIYSFYINRFSSYDVFYGGLANLVVLMIWFYLLSLIFTIGLALNYREEEIELEKTGEINILK